MIIAIEGVDGVGKATVAGYIVGELKNRSIQHVSEAFPRYSIPPFGPLIADSLAHGKTTGADIYARALLFALDRRQWFSHESPNWAYGCVVVVDRWSVSNAAYLHAQSGNPDDATWILDLEHNLLSLPVPDLTLLVEADSNIVARRLEGRVRKNGRDGDKFEQARDLQWRAATAYSTIFKDMTYGSCRVVGNRSTLSDLRGQVLKVMDEVLG